MPIHVITGLPGASKTAEMMVMLVAAAKKADRPIFAAGIDGLKPGLAQVLDDPTKWKDCPDGSLIFIDEAWKWFGHLHSAARQVTPDHVLGLAEHRHRGMDFVWTTQAPAQLYPFARSMIEQHWHIVRKFGTSFRDVYKWGELQDECKSEGVRARAEKSLSAIPSEVFGLYESASVHTIKSRIPFKLLMIPVLVVAAALAVFGVYRYFVPASVAGEPAADGLPAAPVTRAERTGSAKAPATLSAYLDSLTPRAPGLHGSQPVFDDREVAARPRTFCVMSGGPSGDDTCTCYTEQVTKIMDVRQDVCRHTARWGQYDPYLAEVSGVPGEPVPEAPAPAPSSVRGAAGVPSVVGTPAQGNIWTLPPTTGG